MRSGIHRLYALTGLMAFAALAACGGRSSTAWAPAWMAALPAKARQDAALIYVVRPSPEAALVRFSVYLDGQEARNELGRVGAMQHLYFYVQPGPHRIYSKAENWAEFAVIARPGEIIFLRQVPTAGYVISRNHLLRVEQTVGAREVKNTGLGTLHKPSR